ncbi:LOW QUALITY PROTEIN: lengsin [Neosynchiropus ocellatus]
MNEDCQESRPKDQVDGSGMSLGQKKGVRVTGRYSSTLDWGQRQAPSIVHTPPSSPLPPENPTLISIGPQTGRPLDLPGLDEGEDWIADPKTQMSCSALGAPRQTLEELKSILKESPRVRGDGKPGGPYTYLYGSENSQSDERPDSESSQPFSTFKPQTEASRRASKSRGGTPIHQPSGMDSSSSFRSETNTNRQQGARGHTHASGSRGDTGHPQVSGACATLLFVIPLSKRVSTESSSQSPEMSGNHHFVSAMEQIKQQIARENINFVRFEATDLHGVSRSKTVPVRFFHEKAVYGVPMPRSYLELTLSPKSNEVDHANTANFSSDVLLISDLSTFRVLPWAEQTARVICDPCTVTGNALRTSPRLIAKQLLGQLQTLGFSIFSSFTYECSILGAPDRIGPKTLLFPATTLLSNHDLPFIQQLLDSMYCMGADVDSIASASGPGQMEINLRPEFGIAAADSAFTFRTGIKEMARKHSYIASFFTDDGMYNAGVLSHSLWDANGRRSLFQSHEKPNELSEIGRKWLAGLLTHSAALSCLMSPGLGCRSHIAKTIKDPKRVLYATFGCNDNSSSFNIKCHGGRETHIDNKLGSAMANPYIVLAATVAAGMDGIRRNLSIDGALHKAPGQQREYRIPVKLEDALEALGDDHIIRSALGEPFVQYFIAMKRFEIETQELDDERNKCLEYFI